MNKEVSLKYVSNVTRVSVHEYAGQLATDTGKLPIIFRRVLSGWEVELHVIIAGRRWHDLEDSPTTRALFGRLDGMACNTEEEAERRQQSVNPVIRAALFA